MLDIRQQQGVEFTKSSEASPRRRNSEESVQNFPSVFTFERLLAVVQNRYGSCGRSLSDSNESTPALILHIGRDSLWVFGQVC